ncbi:MAG: PP2C family serine/threonine-protein phosphatase [Candidatus Methanoperedens sp.]
MKRRKRTQISVVLIVDAPWYTGTSNPGKTELINRLLDRFRDKQHRNMIAGKKERIAIFSYGQAAGELSRASKLTQEEPVEQNRYMMGNAISEATRLAVKRMKRYREIMPENCMSTIILIEAGELSGMQLDGKYKKIIEEVHRKGRHFKFLTVIISPEGHELQMIKSLTPLVSLSLDYQPFVITKDNFESIWEELYRLIFPKQPTPYIFGTSVIGPYHVQRNIPCQDACAYEVITPESVVIAVADGLGSASKSDIGARTAVESAVGTVKAMLIKRNIDEADLGVIARKAVVTARRELEVKAIDERCNLRDLACTMIVAIIYENNIAVAHIGDGAVVARRNEELVIISEPGESEYINEVVPLTSKEWEKSLFITPDVCKIDSVAVFTDGCQGAALIKKQNSLQPYDRFFVPLFSYAQKLSDLNLGEKDIRGLLASREMSENSEDDKTLVICVLKVNENNGKSSSL